ncbi:MAG: HEAT repeat domain-containing protein [Burkholderiaceae bacterium]|nr:HEAT repeat domain-containing protein [Burkholderiaceae bacterium]
MALKSASKNGGLREVAEREPDRSYAGLLLQLADTDPARRRWAARDLAAHAAAAQPLVDHLLTERDAGVVEAIVTSLETLASPAAVAALLPLLRSEDARLRNGAIEALAAMPAATAPHIDRLLADADADVRLFAVNLLADLRHARVPAWIEQVLRNESEPNVVAAAIEVMTDAGSEALLPALAAAQARFAADPFIGFAADIARSRIGSP